MVPFFIFHTHIIVFLFCFHRSFEICSIGSNNRLHVKITRWILCYFCFIQYVKLYWGKCLSCFPEDCWRSPCCWTLFILTTCLVIKPEPFCPRPEGSSHTGHQEPITRRTHTVNGWSKVISFVCYLSYIHIVFTIL